MLIFCIFFFFNDTATTEIYTLSLHDALPICRCRTVERNEHISGIDEAMVTPGSGEERAQLVPGIDEERPGGIARRAFFAGRSEEHTSELQSRQYLVCRLLLEKKKNKIYRS